MRHTARSIRGRDPADLHDEERAALERRRRITRLLRNIALAVTGIALVGSAYVFLVHLPMRDFPTYASMRESTLHPDWYPPYMPTTATAIREAHDLDTNRQWTTFAVPAPDLHAFTAQLLPVAPELPPIVHWRVKWWPVALNPNRADSTSTAPFKFYRTVSGEYTYAVDSVSGRVYAWRRGT